MPSKESLGQEILIRCHDCGGTLVYKETAEGYEVFHSCKDGKQVREILDEAIREARLAEAEWWNFRLLREAGATTETFQRLAQLRKGKP